MYNFLYLFFFAFVFIVSFIFIIHFIHIISFNHSINSDVFKIFTNIYSMYKLNCPVWLMFVVSGCYVRHSINSNMIIPTVILTIA